MSLPLYAVVLCGGYSTRMGRDKSLLPIPTHLRHPSTKNLTPSNTSTVTSTCTYMEHMVGCISAVQERRRWSVEQHTTQIHDQITHHDNQNNHITLNMDMKESESHNRRCDWIVSMRIAEILISCRRNQSLPTLPHVTYIFDMYEDIGPSAGILSAYHHIMTVRSSEVDGMNMNGMREQANDFALLVLAVDFPCTTPDAIEYIIQQHEASTYTHTDTNGHADAHKNTHKGDDPNLPGDTHHQPSCIAAVQPYVTCYYHIEDDIPEPLFAIWSSNALKQLKYNSTVRKRTGPCFTIKEQIRIRREPELGNSDDLHNNRDDNSKNGIIGTSRVNLVKPVDEHLLYNTNTMEQYNKIIHNTEPPPQ